MSIQDELRETAKKIDGFKDKVPCEENSQKVEQASKNLREVAEEIDTVEGKEAPPSPYPYFGVPII